MPGYSVEWNRCKLPRSENRVATASLQYKKSKVVGVNQNTSPVIYTKRLNKSVAKNVETAKPMALAKLQPKVSISGEHQPTIDSTEKTEARKAGIAGSLSAVFVVGSIAISIIGENMLVSGLYVNVGFWGVLAFVLIIATIVAAIICTLQYKKAKAHGMDTSKGSLFAKIGFLLAVLAIIATAIAIPSLFSFVIQGP